MSGRHGYGDLRVAGAGIHGLDAWEMDASAAADLVLTADRNHRSAAEAIDAPVRPIVDVLMATERQWE